MQDIENVNVRDQVKDLKEICDRGELRGIAVASRGATIAGKARAGAKPGVVK